MSALFLSTMPDSNHRVVNGAMNAFFMIYYNLQYNIQCFSFFPSFLIQERVNA